LTKTKTGHLSESLSSQIGAADADTTGAWAFTVVTAGLTVKTSSTSSEIGAADADTTGAWAFTVVAGGLTLKIGEAKGEIKGEDTDIGEAAKGDAKGESNTDIGETAAKGEVATIRWFCILDF
jgi:hypothetical protein